jgi:hypothetical protein
MRVWDGNRYKVEDWADMRDRYEQMRMAALVEVDDARAARDLQTEPLGWVRAQLAYLELVAESTRGASGSWRNFDMDGELRDDVNAGEVAYVSCMENRLHMAEHDPERVLRRIGKTREVLDGCESAVEGWHYEETKELARGLIRATAEAWGWEAGS